MIEWSGKRAEIFGEKKGKTRVRRLKKTVEKAAKLLKDLLFPVRCPICGEIVDWSKKNNRICEKCRPKLRRITEPFCKRCGKPLKGTQEEFCYDCKETKHHYSQGRAVYVYDSMLKQSIGNLKYHNKREYAVFYIEEIATYLKKDIQRWKPLCIVPVPLYKKKRRSRGFNQAELLAKGIGKKMGIPVYSNLLKRRTDTLPQKKLGKKERKENLKQVFYLEKSMETEIKGKNILIVDDIYTTGSTVDQCSKVLKRAGAGEVYFVCIAIGAGTEG